MADVTTIDGNPYAAPGSPDSFSPEPAPETGPSRKALRAAGVVMALYACLRGFEIATSAMRVVRVVGRDPKTASSAMAWVGWAPSAVGFAIVALLSLALLAGNVRYRKLAWIYVVVTAGLAVVTQVFAQSFSPMVLPLTFVIAFLAQKALFAAAIALLLVGRAGPTRLVAGTVTGLLFVVSVFAVHFL